MGGTVKTDMPILTNLRLDPMERTGSTGSMSYYNWFVFEFWRFVFVQQVVEKAGQTFIRVPAGAEPASFNLEAVKEQLKKAAKSQAAA